MKFWRINLLLFCSDEQHLYKWDVKTQVPTQVAKLPEDFFPLDLQWLCNTRTAAKATGPGNSSGNKTNDSLLICSSDGRYIMLNRSARAERIVNAHVGSINAGKWSPDGTGLLTAGEDGVIKIWSKLGMLRSTIIQNETPIRAACWSPNSMSIAYCTGAFLAIKPLAANSKLIKVNDVWLDILHQITIKLSRTSFSSVESSQWQCELCELVRRSANDSIWR